MELNDTYTWYILSRCKIAMLSRPVEFGGISIGITA